MKSPDKPSAKAAPPDTPEAPLPSCPEGSGGERARDAANGESSMETRSGFGADLYDWANALLSAVTIVVLISAFIAGIFTVSLGSMTNTLQPDDVMLISDLFYTPEKGDIIMFTHMGTDVAYDWENDRHAPMVKRIVAVAGDRIYYDPDAKKLVVNGVLQEEPYLREQDFRAKGSYLEHELTVPQGHIFVCGDNRNGSTDSREFGLVDTRMILGRVLLRLLPLNRFGTV